MDDKNNNPNTTNTGGSEQNQNTYSTGETKDPVKEVMEWMQDALY